MLKSSQDNIFWHFLLVTCPGHIGSEPTLTPLPHHTLNLSRGLRKKSGRNDTPNLAEMTLGRNDPGRNHSGPKRPGTPHTPYPALSRRVSTNGEIRYDFNMTRTVGVTADSFCEIFSLEIIKKMKTHNSCSLSIQRLKAVNKLLQDRE